MTTNRVEPSVVASTLMPHVNNYLMTRALAEIERENIDKIQRRVLKEGQYVGRRRQHDGSWGKDFRIVDPKDTRFMIKGDSEAYYARLHDIYTSMGYKLKSVGYCPACIAETLQTEAEWALLAAAEEFFPEASNDNLLCAGLEVREQYIDLLCRLVVNSPNYVAPRLPEVSNTKELV